MHVTRYQWVNTKHFEKHFYWSIILTEKYLYLITSVYSLVSRLKQSGFFCFVLFMFVCFLSLSRTYYKPAPNPLFRDISFALLRHQRAMGLYRWLSLEFAANNFLPCQKWAPSYPALCKQEALAERIPLACLLLGEWNSLTNAAPKSIQFTVPKLFPVSRLT